MIDMKLIMPYNLHLNNFSVRQIFSEIQKQAARSKLCAVSHLWSNYHCDSGLVPTFTEQAGAAGML
jgi:hypothetical protein